MYSASITTIYFSYGVSETTGRSMMNKGLKRAIGQCPQGDLLLRNLPVVLFARFVWH